MLLVAIGMEGAMVLLGWGLGALLGVSVWGQLHPTLSAVGYGVLACIPMLLVLVWIVRSRWAPLATFRKTMDERVAPLFANCTLLDLVIISALAGLGEEVLFRGALQGALVEGMGLWMGVAITSIVFGLAHAVTVLYVVYATLVGVYLGVLLIVFDNLLIPIIAHGVYDFIALGYIVYVRLPALGRAVVEAPVLPLPEDPDA